MTKEEIKNDAEKLATAFGYNTQSFNLDVINVKDAYCIGFTKGVESVSLTSLLERFIENAVPDTIQVQKAKEFLETIK